VLNIVDDKILIDCAVTHDIVGPLRPDHNMLPTSGKQMNARQSADDAGYDFAKKLIA
jgi:hypothetical protein